MSDYSMKNFGDPRVVRDLEVPPENLSHSPSTSLLDELEANRVRASQNNVVNQIEANRARLIAEQKAIITKQAERVKPRKYDFESVVEERKDLANTDLSGFLDSFEK